MKRLHCISLSHKNYDIQVRSRFSMSPEQCSIALNELCELETVNEACILNTCNRFEIVCIVSDPGIVFSWLSLRTKTNLNELLNYFVDLSGIDALKHIMRVVAGLEAKIYGEKNINGQVKQAFLEAKKNNLIGHTLETIYAYSFQVSKAIQNHIALPMSSITQCFFHELDAQYSDRYNKNFLFIGTGKLVKEVLTNLIPYEPSQIVVASHNPERVCDELRRVATVIHINDIAPYLFNTDVIFSATNTTEPILKDSDYGHFNPKRQIYIADASLPRSFDTSIRRYTNVRYFDVDDLASLSEKENKSKYGNLDQYLDGLINKEVLSLQQILDKSYMSKIIEPQREILRQYLDNVVAKTINDADFKVNPEKHVKKLTKELSGTMLHLCTILLRRCCKDNDMKTINDLRTLIEKHNNSYLLTQKVDDR
ncbi:hypothetical protein [Legionella taurinensis]|uniref:Glutamyl-tRNA reductase n=1 Tax=Legionella taurinensis TaxID=70611 RepID=A0A3A5L6Z1_9GAMM|nr:hypothetical protein [Legionella taurinensis]RJT46616.1 hypothetical protein D6J04_08730 [Legionella taurinensis]RJT66608.1 hypothetical protein D6J03_09825 [Legionella taurinensis]STY25255.1 glutamyl tRNA reductase [Legionella taurinensis]